MILVLDFCFGQRRTVVQAPVHGFEALVHVISREKLDERTCDGGFIFRAHREVWIAPPPEHRQPDELLPLDVHVLCGILPALRANLRHRHLRFARAKLIVDLDFDGQAMTIPARHIRRVEARHAFRFDDEILQDFVERVPQVDVPVGIRRPVMQDVNRLSDACSTHLIVNVLLVPPLEHLGLGLRQVGLHGKSRTHQIEGLLEVNAL